MTTTPHTSCTHPATKAARARCRKERALAPQVDTSLADLVAAYHAGEAIEVIAAQAPAHLAQGYYDNTLDAEEFIASLTDDAPAEGMMTLTSGKASIEVPYDDLVFLTRKPHPRDSFGDEYGTAMLRRQSLMRELGNALGIDRPELIALVKALVWQYQ